MKKISIIKDGFGKKKDNEERKVVYSPAGVKPIRIKTDERYQQQKAQNTLLSADPAPGRSRFMSLTQPSSFEEYSRQRKEEEEREARVLAAEQLMQNYGFKKVGNQSVYVTPFSPLPKPTKENTATKANAPGLFGIEPEKYVRNMQAFDRYNELLNQGAPKRATLTDVDNEGARNFLDKWFKDETSTGELPTMDDVLAKYSAVEPFQQDTYWMEWQSVAPALESYMGQGGERDQQAYQKQLDDAQLARDEAIKLFGADAEQYAGKSTSDYYAMYGNEYDAAGVSDAFEKEAQNKKYGWFGSYDESDAILQGVLNRGENAVPEDGSLISGNLIANQQMNDHQRRTFMYLASKYGNDVAVDYYNKLLTDEGFNKQAYMLRDQALREQANDNWLASTGKSILTAPMQLAGTAYAIGQGLKGEDIDPYHNAFATTQWTQTPRDEVGNMITKNYGTVDKQGNPKDNVWSWLMKAGYMALTSGADSASSAFLGGGLAGTGAALQGLWSMGGSAQDAVMRGGSTEQALLLGGINAVVESVTEYLPMDHLIKTLDSKDIKTFGQMLKNAFLGGLKEAPGEGASSLLGYISDSMIMDKLSNWNALVKEKGELGAALHVVGDVLTESFVGFLSGEASNTLAGSKAMVVNNLIPELEEAAVNRVDQANQEQTAQQNAPVNWENRDGVRPQGAELMQERRGNVTQDGNYPADATAQTVAAQETAETKAEEGERPVQTTEPKESKGKRFKASNAPKNGEKGYALKSEQNGVIAGEDGAVEPVSATAIDHVDKGKVYVRLKNPVGVVRVVSTDDVDFAPDTKALLDNENVKHLDERGVGVYLDGYDSTLATPAQYSKAFFGVYDRGHSGMDYDGSVISSGAAQMFLTKDAAGAAWKAGTRQFNSENGVLTGNARKAQANVVKALNKLSGGKIRMTDEDLGGANAQYNPETGEILISNKAEKGAYAYYAVHELAHKLKAENQQTWVKFRELMTNAMVANGVDIAQAKKAEEEKFKQNGIKYTEADVIEEVICNNAASILQDAEIVKDLIGKDRTLMEMVTDFLREFLDNLNQTMQSLGKEMSELESWKGLQALKDDHESLNAIYKSLKEGLEQTNNQQSQQDAADTNIKHSYPPAGKLANNGIERDMPDVERAEVLRDMEVQTVPMGNLSPEAKALVERLGKGGMGRKEIFNAIKALPEYKAIQGVDLYSDSITVPFQFSNGSLDETLKKMETNGRFNFKQAQRFVELLGNFKEHVKNANAVEVHTDRYLYRLYDTTKIENYGALFGIAKNGNTEVPVLYELKNFKGNEKDKLHLVATFEETKKGPMQGSENADNSANFTPTNTGTYIVSDYVSKINPLAGNMLKYFPNELMDSEQIRSAEIARLEQEKYILEKIRLRKTVDLKTGKPVTQSQIDEIDRQISAIRNGGTASGLSENVDGVDVVNGSAVKYSLRSWTDEEKAKTRKELIKSGFEKEAVDGWIDDVNSVAAVVASDKTRLDFEADPDQVMLKDNDEYVKTLDASTLCAKRLLYQGTFNAIQHKLPNTVMTSDRLLDLLNMMKDAGYETPCGICYVESRRRHLGKFAEQWLNGRPKTKDQKAWEPYSGDYIPTLDELTTTDGLAKLKAEHPQTYQDFVSKMSSLGSSNPKIVELRTDYRGEVRKISKATAEKIKRIGGLRVQSFSDFETPHMLDMMQAVLDMTSKGLTSQAYTKVPNFAWVFGDTGIKINLSLIADGNGLDKNGKLVFSSSEGMDFNEAMRLRERYSENVGTILVGANDDHIKAAMADPRIDYIIPFHRSGWGQNELKKVGVLQEYTDYQSTQNERVIKGYKKNGAPDYGKPEGGNFYPIDYWDYSKTGDENAETYLRMCEDDGRVPKFDQFLTKDEDGHWVAPSGYWKLLIDFKMYDNDGNGAPQQTVRPKFNMTEANRVLEEYAGGANDLPVANDIVDRFVAELQGEESSLDADTEDVKYSLREDNNEWRQNYRAKVKETARKQRYRSQITEQMNDIVKMLEKPTDKKHVLDGLQSAVLEFCKSTDLGGRNQQTRSLKSRIDTLAKAMENAQKGTMDGAEQYIIDPDLLDKMKILAEETESLGSMTDLTADQMRDMRDMVKAVAHTISTADQMFTAEKGAKISAAATSSMEEMSRKKDKKQREGMLGKLDELMNNGMLDSFRYFDRLGASGRKMFQALRDGFDVKVRSIAQANEHVQKNVKDIDKNILKGKKAKKTSFTVSGGDISLTKAQIMELYCLSKRKAAQKHLYNGGITTDDHVTMVRVSEADVQNIISTLTVAERKVADALQSFLEKDCAAWGNETSNRMYGYSKYGEDGYYPMRVDDGSIDTKVTEQGKTENLWAMVHPGFSKELSDKANQPLRIGDIFDTYSRHVDSMSSYRAYAAPIADLLRWYNYKPYGEQGIKTMLTLKYGVKGREYIPNLIRDLNGQTNAGYSPGLTEAITKNAKAAAVGANIRVVIQQPTAIARATAMMSPKYVAEGAAMTPKRMKECSELAMKYCPIAMWKNMGYYETHLGKGLRDMMFGGQTFLEKASDVSMKPAGWADRMTWAALWNACEKETKALHPELSGNALYEMTGKRLSEIIDYTQVVDTPFHRSQLMRSKNGSVQMATAFMSEPTKTYNMLQAAVARWAENRRDPVANAQLGRTLLVFVATGVLNAAAQSVIDAMRDDDDDEELWEKYTQAFGGNVIDNVNPLQIVPYISDIVSIVQGYEPSRMDMQMVQKVVEIVKELSDGEKSKWSSHKWTRKVLSTVSYATGVPLENLYRDVTSLGNTVAMQFGGKPLSNQHETATPTVAYGNMYDALLNGNQKTFNRIDGKLKADKESPKSNSDIDNGIAKLLSEEDERIAQAWEAKEAGKASELNRIRQEIVNELSANDVVSKERLNEIVDKAITTHGNKVSPKEEKEFDPEKSLKVRLFTADDVAQAVRDVTTGKATESAARMMLSEVVADSDAKDPEKSVRSSVLGEVKKDYLAAVKSGNTKKATALGSVMKNVLGATESDMKTWVTDSYRDDLRAGVDAYNTTNAKNVVAKLRAQGLDDSNIKSSLSKYKQLYIDAMKRGDRTTANRIKNTLMSLGLKGKNGKALYTDDTFAEWLK